MTNVIVGLAVTLTVVLGWIRLFGLLVKVRHSVLIAAAWWAVAAQATLTIAWIASLAPVPISPGILDQAWLVAAAIAVCPFVAILGARRGRLLDWSLFVLIPLIVVLEWPALAQWTHTWNGRRLELELPSQIAFAVVLFMSVGNFFGTRFVVPAMFWLLSWYRVFASLVGSRGPNLMWVALWQLCFWRTIEFAIHQKNHATGWNRVWLDFRDHFGSVWAYRLMSRVNEIAKREQWPWRLGSDGLKPLAGNPANSSDSSSDQRVEKTFRWLLKPFVDPDWIAARLDAPAQPATCSTADGTAKSTDHDALH